MSSNQYLIAGQLGQFDYPEQNPQYQGNPLDPRFKKGPLNSRGCRDVFWCILYLMMLAGMAGVTAYSYQNGRPDLLLAPYDSKGNHCGFDAYLDYPQVYVQGAQDFICVKSCPEFQGDVLLCLDEPCPSAQYATQRLLTVCFPSQSVPETIRQQIQDTLGVTSSQEILADLKNTWPLQLITALVALFVALLVTVQIRYTASCLVWSVIFLYFSFLGFLGVFCFQISKNPEWQNFVINDNSEGMKKLAYFIWGFAVFSFLVFLCLIKKIRLAIAVMKAAADFTRQVCEATLVPLVMFLVICVFLSYWLFTSIYLISCGEIEASPNSPFGAVELNPSTKWLLFYDLFALYWNINFAMAFSQFIIASSCSMWYFSHSGAELSHPVSRSVYRGLFNHAGSLALGSLILAVVGIIRFCMTQVHKAFKNQNMVGRNNVTDGFTKCWFNYCSYCLACFERFIRFINQNAYIMIALSGDSFCVAAHQAFYLIMRNALKVSVTHGIGEVFTLLGNMFIGISSTMIGYVMLTEIDYFSNDIISPIIPTMGFLITSFTIGSLFMNVYGMAIDTILLCYIVDMELNSNKGGAQSIPPSLREFIDEYK